MKKQVKTVSLMDLRANIGSLINEVYYKDIILVIEKYGKPVCQIIKHEKKIPEDKFERLNKKVDRLCKNLKIE